MNINLTEANPSTVKCYFTGKCATNSRPPIEETNQPLAFLLTAFSFVFTSRHCDTYIQLPNNLHNSHSASNDKHEKVSVDCLSFL